MSNIYNYRNALCIFWKCIFFLVNQRKQLKKKSGPPKFQELIFQKIGLIQVLMSKCIVHCIIYNLNQN